MAMAEISVKKKKGSIGRVDDRYETETRLLAEQNIGTKIGYERNKCTSYQAARILPQMMLQG